MGFDLLMWDARQNAARHRQRVARRTIAAEQTERVRTMVANGDVGDQVRAYVDAYAGFDFCAAVAGAYR